MVFSLLFVVDHLWWNQTGISLEMETSRRDDELASFLTVLPPVDFCCVYGSTLHPNNQDKVFIYYISWNSVWWESISCFWLTHQKCSLRWWTTSLEFLIPCNGTLRWVWVSQLKKPTNFQLDFIGSRILTIVWIKNLKMNSDHYASWMVHLGGARLVCFLSILTFSTVA